MTRPDAAPDAAGDDLARALRLTTLSLAFGRVERATRHEDGIRPETDTDHTVMLALVACELAPAHLDRAKVAAFALVHDLAEVYAGDTQTLTISAEGMAAKREREDAARARLVSELGAGSWIAATLATYEEQREPEARFVRAVDKVLPKLTHAFNGCAAARALTDRAGFAAAHERQLQKLRDEYPEFPEAIELLRASMVHSEGCWTDDAPPVTADLARLRAPSPELAAIGARHQERLALPLYVVAGPHVEGARRTLSPLPPTQLDADIGTLLAHIAAQQAAHAAALDGARAAALREGLLRGLALAQEHAAPYIDDDMGAPQVDWTDAVAAVGDATTVAPSAAPTAPSIGAVRAAAVSAFAMWLRRHKTPAGPWTLAKEAEEEGAAVIGELIEAALAAPRGQ